MPFMLNYPMLIVNTLQVTKLSSCVVLFVKDLVLAQKLFVLVRALKYLQIGSEWSGNISSFET